MVLFSELQHDTNLREKGCFAFKANLLQFFSHCFQDSALPSQCRVCYVSWDRLKPVHCLFSQCVRWAPRAKQWRVIHELDWDTPHVPLSTPPPVRLGVFFFLFSFSFLTDAPASSPLRSRHVSYLHMLCYSLTVAVLDEVTYNPFILRCIVMGCEYEPLQTLAVLFLRLFGEVL